MSVLARMLLRLGATAGSFVLLLAMTASASSATGNDVAVIRAAAAGNLTAPFNGSEVALTFVGRNNGPGTASLSLNLVSTSGLQLVNHANGRQVSPELCVDRAGREISADSPSCEVGDMRSGETGSLTLFALVTAPTGAVASARVCATDLNGTTDGSASNNCRSVRLTVR